MRRHKHLRGPKPPCNPITVLKAAFAPIKLAFTAPHLFAATTDERIQNAILHRTAPRRPDIGAILDAHEYCLAVPR